MTAAKCGTRDDELRAFAHSCVSRSELRLRLLALCQKSGRRRSSMEESCPEKLRN
jgi:hypothetical protein